LLAIRNGNYTVYVFKNLQDNSLMMCTKLPNWIIPIIDVGEEGYIKFQKAEAGMKYYNPSTGAYDTYKYSNNYILNYIKKTDITNSNINL
jgi:hypothetical protein